jgi:arylsulfatase A-like enzyme
MSAMTTWIVLSLFLLPARVFAAQRPNILFIMSDDHAAHALSSYGSRINATPHLDSIATNGIRFANCFVNNSICTPSRAAILTGKYSHKNGVTVFNRFDGSQPHLAKYLQQAGYQTAMVGKWHLFSDPTGFDYWNVLPGQGRYHDPVMIEMGQTNTLKGYATDLITDISMDFLERRDSSKPFFLCTQHKAPHREWSPDTEHAALYEDRGIPQPITFNDDYAGRSQAAAEATMRIERDFKRTDLKKEPPPELSGAELKNWKYQRYIKDYLRCVASIDDNVGRLLGYLRTSGLMTNTLVIYTSDQGFFLGDHGWYDKRFMYEESLRMPLVMSFPGFIKPGTVNTQMVLNVDFAPTFLELAGAPIPSDMQGRSFASMLRGETPAQWRHSMYYRYYHYPSDHRVQPHYGVRTHRHKLIHFNKLDEWELYDLQADPYETNNIYSAPAQAGIVSHLKLELARLKVELDDRDQFADILDNEQKIRPVGLELALQYDFARQENGSATDHSVNRLHLPLGKLAVVEGRTGKAVHLTGETDTSVKSGPRTFTPAGKPFTIGAWCKPEATNGVLLSWGGGANGFSLYLENGVPHAALRSKGELFITRGRQPIAVNKWVHLAAILRTNGRLALLVDGKPSGATPAVAIAAKPHDAFSLGADPGSKVSDYQTPARWRGLIEDVRLYWGELDSDALEDWSAPHPLKKASSASPKS